MRRRTFLGALAAATAGVFLTSPLAAAVSQAPRGPRLGSPTDARRIAQVFLRHHPDQAPRPVLAAGLGCSGDAAWETLCDALAEARRADFRAGRTLVVDGWLIAEAEARLCALSMIEGGGAC